MAASLGAALVLARVLGVAEYGVYIYVVTWVGVLLLPSVAGTDTAGLRFLGAYRTGGEAGHLSAYLRHSRRRTGWLSLAVALGAAVAIWGLGARVSAPLRYTFWIACVLIPISTRAQLQMSVLRAFSRPVAALGAEMLLRPLFLAVAVLSWYVLSGTRPSAAMAMGIGIAAACASLVVLSRQAHRSVGSPAPMPVSPGLREEWNRTGLAVMLVAGFHLVLAQTDIILLGVFRGTTDAGVYAVAVRLSMLVAFALSAVNVLLAPMISGLYSSGRTEDLGRLLRSVAKWLAAVAVCAALVLLVGGRWILALFGPDFVAGFVPMTVLIAGQLVNVLCGSVGFVLTMTGHHRRAVYILGVAAALNVGLNFALIPALGMVGAALGTAVTLGVWNLAMLVYVRRRLQLDPSVLSLFRSRL